VSWISYGARNVEEASYRYAYCNLFDFPSKSKAVLSAEVDVLKSSKQFAITAQLGGDALFRVIASIYTVGIDLSIWGRT